MDKISENISLAYCELLSTQKLYIIHFMIDLFDGELCLNINVGI